MDAKWLLLVGLLACMALTVGDPGCSNNPMGGSPDLTMLPPGDLRAPPGDLRGGSDLATRIPDLATLPDARGGDGPAVVVCNLGNDPLPCTADATCYPNGARCDTGRHYCVCITPNCTPGMDQTCNDDPGVDGIWGHCVTFGSCMCLDGHTKDPKTGKCM